MAKRSYNIDIRDSTRITFQCRPCAVYDELSTIYMSSSNSFQKIYMNISYTATTQVYVYKTFMGECCYLLIIPYLMDHSNK